MKIDKRKLQNMFDTLLEEVECFPDKTKAPGRKGFFDNTCPFCYKSSYHGCDIEHNKECIISKIKELGLNATL